MIRVLAVLVLLAAGSAQAAPRVLIEAGNVVVENDGAKNADQIGARLRGRALAGRPVRGVHARAGKEGQ